jgi:hypothetical protein
MAAAPFSYMPTSSDGIHLTHFEEWMTDQVIALSARLWSRDPSAESIRFRSTFEHPFQKSRAVRLVALADNEVCGFQSYVYWPYVRDGQVLHTLQSGWSMVAPEHQGRRIFARLLSYSWLPNYPHPADALIGFPLATSYGSLIRNGWVHITDLAWMVRPIIPLRIRRFRNPSDVPTGFDSTPEPITPWHPPMVWSRLHDPAFSEWQTQAHGNPPWYFHFGYGNEAIRYQLRPRRRGVLTELTIGDVLATTEDASALRVSLQRLVAVARSCPLVAFLSLALNPGCADSSLLACARSVGFRFVRRSVPFTAKALAEGADINGANSWRLLRSDIDTW